MYSVAKHNIIQAGEAEDEGDSKQLQPAMNRGVNGTDPVRVRGSEQAAASTSHQPVKSSFGSVQGEAIRCSSYAA